MQNSQQTPPQKNDFEAQMIELSEALEKPAKTAGTGAVTPEMTVALSKIESMIEYLQETAGALKDAETETLLQEILEQIKRKNELESVNERLFATLHEELRGYKDAFLFESIQKPVVRDLIHLLDDMLPLTGQISNADTVNSAVCENLENCIVHLREILHRMDVTEIPENIGQFDMRLQKAVSVEPATSEEENNRVLKITRSGYQWRDKVIRPQEVIIARFKKT